jgi:hypothetical protein
VGGVSKLNVLPPTRLGASHLTTLPTASRGEGIVPAMFVSEIERVAGWLDALLRGDVLPAQLQSSSGSPM